VGHVIELTDLTKVFGRNRAVDVGIEGFRPRERMDDACARFSADCAGSRFDRTGLLDRIGGDGERPIWCDRSLEAL